MNYLGNPFNLPRPCYNITCLSRWAKYKSNHWFAGNETIQCEAYYVCWIGTINSISCPAKCHKHITFKPILLQSNTTAQTNVIQSPNDDYPHPVHCGNPSCSCLLKGNNELYFTWYGNVYIAVQSSIIQVLLLTVNIACYSALDQILTLPSVSRNQEPWRTNNYCLHHIVGLISSDNKHRHSSQSKIITCFNAGNEIFNSPADLSRPSIEDYNIGYFNHKGHYSWQW